MARSCAILGLAVALIWQGFLEPAWAGRGRRAVAENRDAQPGPPAGEKTPASPLPRPAEAAAEPGNDNPDNRAEPLDAAVPIEVERFLAAREARYGKIESLRLSFTSSEYDPAHGGKDWRTNPLHRHGHIRYFRVGDRVLSVDFYPPSGLPQFVFEFDSPACQRKYQIRTITPAEFDDREIWLDIIPRDPSEVAEFEKAVLRLCRYDFGPKAMKIYRHGDSFTSVEFGIAKFNNQPDDRAQSEDVVSVEVERFLDAREARFGKTENLSLDFTSWSYPVPGDEERTQQPMIRTGNFRYVAPGKIRYRYFEEYQQVSGVKTEHSLLNITTYVNGRHMQVVDEWRGAVVEDEAEVEALYAGILLVRDRGPLSLLLSTDSRHWQRQFHILIVTPKEYEETEVWLQVSPRHLLSVDVFQQAILRFSKENLTPLALWFDRYGPWVTEYQFENVKINDLGATFFERGESSWLD